MAIPCTGQLSHSIIHNELYGVNPGPNSDVSLRDMSSKIDLSVPDAESEFYCYEKPPPFSVSIITGSASVYYTHDSGDNWTVVTNPGTFTLATGLKCSKGMKNVMIPNYNGNTLSTPSISSNNSVSWGLTNQQCTFQRAAGVPWAGVYWYYTGLVSGQPKLLRGALGSNVFTVLTVSPGQVKSIAVADSNYVFIAVGATIGLQWSNNNMATLNNSTGTNINHMEDLCCSSSGQYVHAVKTNIYQRSTNYGSSFVQNSTTFSGKGILAVSTDNTGKYVLVISATSVHVSSDYGVTFSDKTSLITGSFAPTITPDCRGVTFTGEIMMFPGGTNKLNLSTDYGVTWSILRSPVNGDAYCIEESVPPSTDPPVADFYAYELTPYTTTYVPFKDTSTNEPTSWLWVFTPNTITYKSGSSSTSRDPIVKFNNAGTYTVKLTATNANGSDSETKTNYITALVYIAPPDAAFHASKTDPDVGETIQFIDDSTGTPTSWDWLIVTGIGGEDYEWIGTAPWWEQNPFIKFLTSGYYTVKLTATNAGGSDSRTKTNYIHVGNNLMTDIVSYYKFSNSNLLDSHGNNDGIGEGIMAGDALGIIDQAVHFNGSDTGVRFPCKGGATCGTFEYNDFSISMWLKQTEQGDEGWGQVFFSKFNAYYPDFVGTDYIIVSFDEAGQRKVRFSVAWSNGNGTYNIVFNHALPLGTWEHHVAVKDGTSIKYYINGELKGTETCATTIQFSLAKPYIGRIEYYTLNPVPPYDPIQYAWFNGSVDEVGFWSRGLTAAEVLLLYNNGDGYQYPFD